LVSFFLLKTYKQRGRERENDIRERAQRHEIQTKEQTKNTRNHHAPPQNSSMS